MHNVTQRRMPKGLVRAYLHTKRFLLNRRRDLTYKALEGWALLLSLFCGLTRQEGFEGFRMSYWRWLAVIHLAFKEREQRATALCLGYSVYHGSGGPQILLGGKWRAVPAGAAGITRVGQVSPLYYKKVAGGLPVLQDLSVFPGNIFFVDSGTTVQGADTAGFGTHPDAPFLTVDFAIGQCTLNQGDVIFVLPGHNEGLGNAQADLDVAGISVVGVGIGSARPRIDFDHANASIDIGASGCMIKNIRLLPSVTDVLIAIDCETLFTDHVLQDIEVEPGEDGAGVDEFAAGIEMKVGITRCSIKGFLYDQDASAAGTLRAIYFNGASTRVRVSDFWIEILGAGAVAGIEGTGSSLRSLIENGTIITDAEPGIELAAGQTGVIKDVDIFANLATIAAATVAAGMAHFRVRYVEVGDESDAVVKTASVND